MKTKDSFKKPPYYNRLVKLHEKSLSVPSQNHHYGEKAKPGRTERWPLALAEFLLILEERPGVWDDQKLDLLFETVEAPLPKTFILFCEKQDRTSDEFYGIETQAFNNGT